MPATLVVAAAGVVIGLLSMPDFDTKIQREGLTTFFGASAQAIATLLIAIAAAARYAVRDARIAVITIAYSGLGEVASVTALSPGLPTWLYQPLFVVTVAAGLGALATTLLVAASTIASDASKQSRALQQALLDKLSGGG